MREGLQPAQQQTKRAGVQRRARVVERARYALGLRKSTDRDQDRDHASGTLMPKASALRYGQHRRGDVGRGQRRSRRRTR